MTVRTPICNEFGIEYPIFAFTIDKEVCAAVSRAGGFGVYGALRHTPEELDEALSWIDEHTEGKPYGVDVVMPASYVGGDFDPDEMFEQLQGSIPEEHKRYVEDVLDRYGVPPMPSDEPAPRELLGWTDATARPQVDAALKHPIKLLVNALGPPPVDVVEAAHAHGVQVAALVGSADHARKQVANGVDIIVATGTEAAGHTPDVASMVLWPEVVDAVSPRPVLVGGGVGSGRQMAAALALGAAGVWTGSIWLTTVESQVQPAVRDKLLRATSRDTVRSRSLSGKPARQLRTAWTDAWDDPAGPGALPMPLQFMLTAEAVYRIYRSENPDLMGMPVGQIVGRMNEVRPVATVIADMVRECEETIASLQELR
jgi:NAD(P)H-dependent flavin oxidoreductase YrpB (nitropropane dioxygenase family)